MDYASYIINGAVTACVVFGIMKTEMKYLRRDVDSAHTRMDDIMKILLTQLHNKNHE